MTSKDDDPINTIIQEKHVLESETECSTAEHATSESHRHGVVEAEDTITSLPSSSQTTSDQRSPTTSSRDNSRNEPHSAVESHASSSAVDYARRNPRPRYFHSRRVKKGEVEMPWLDEKDPREKWVTIIPVIGLVLGCIAAAILVWDGIRSVVHHEFCLRLDEDFASDTINKDVWLMEQEVGGFGNGQFDQTTDLAANAYVDKRSHDLRLHPTAQDAILMTTNNTLNLTHSQTCTSPTLNPISCVASTNTTNGKTVPPARSARLSTRNSVSIRYGRVEVTARLPTGDWLWPAIWMLPTSSRYGPWPRSGEIDIMESRGNNHTYPLGGNNVMSSTLHWGPDSANDAWWRTYSKKSALRSTFADQFHTFGLEWTPTHLFTYIDSQLSQVLYVPFDKPFWKDGKFPPGDANGTRLIDPWSQTAASSAPFNEEFYLIINLAVGAQNGWFEDGVAGKPWVDHSESARRDFWEKREEWSKEWDKDDGKGGRKGEMVIKRVKMWQLKGYGGC